MQSDDEGIDVIHSSRDGIVKAIIRGEFDLAVMERMTVLAEKMKAISDKLGGSLDGGNKR